MWNARTGEVVARLGHKHIVRTCDMCPGADKGFRVRKDGDYDREGGGFGGGRSKDLRIVTASQDSMVRIWNIPENRIEAEWSVTALPNSSPSNSPSVLKPVRSVLWVSSDLIVTVSFDGLVTWWRVSELDASNTRTTTRVRDIDLKGITGQVEHLPQLHQLHISYNSSLHILDALTGGLLKHVTLDYKLSCFSVNPEKTRFITGCSTDTWVRVHAFGPGGGSKEELFTGKGAVDGELLETFKGHHGPVHSIAYSPDGYVAASGGEDGTIRLWKMKEGPFGLWN